MLKPTSDKSLTEAMDDIIPDTVQIEQNSILNQYQDTVSSVKLVCDALAKSLVDDYAAAIAECKRQCDMTHDNCSGCYQATIKTFQDRVGTIAAKCQSQARDALNYAISNTLQYLGSLEVPPPTELQINESMTRRNPPQFQQISPTGVKVVTTSGSGGTTGETGGGPPQCPPGQVAILHADGTYSCVLGGGDGGTGPGGGGPGGPGGCGASDIDPCGTIPASYTSQQNGDRTVYYLKTPVYDSCGNLIGCWQQPIPCVPSTDPNCIVTVNGVPCTNSTALTNITGKTAGGKCAGTCPKITAICITCTDPNNCVPPWECPDGWDYDPATGKCTQTGGTGGNGCGPFDSAPTKLPSGTRVGRDPVSGKYWICPTDPPAETTWDEQYPWPVFACPDGNTSRAVAVMDSHSCSWALIALGLSVEPESQLLQLTVPCGQTTGGGGPGGPGNPPPTGDYCGIGDQFHQPGVTAETPFQYQDIANKLATGIGDISPFGGIINTVLDTLSGGKLSNVISGSLGFGSLIKVGGSVLLNAIGGLISDFVPCNSAEFGSATAAGVVTGLLNNLGIIPDLAITQIRYAENYNCQYLIPGQGQLDSAFLHGELQESDWTNGTRMNGNCVPWATAVRDAGYFRFSPADLIELNRRGLIEQGDFDNRIALTNIRNSDDTELLKQLANYKQTVDSSISQNIVGADSETISATLQTSEGFADWYSANGNRIADSYGFTQQQAELLYRQSRRLPDIGLVFDAYRRIKSDTDIDGTGRQANPVTSDELDAYLNTTGLPSVWANRAAALTYAPISIRHLKLLYETGEIDVHELAERYEALTYSPEDAQHLANALAVTTNEAKAKIDGVTDKATAVKLFQEDGINEDQLYQMLLTAGILPSSIQGIVDTAKTTRDARVRKAKVSSLKKRFLMGDYDVATVGGKLADYGIANERIGQIISDWREELELEHKLPSAQAICQWYIKRFITVDDYLQRLSNLGYSANDAANFVAACTSEAADKLAKQAATEAAKRAKALEKQIAAEEKAIKAAQQCRPPAKPVCGAKPTVRRTVTKRSKSTLNAGITVSETASQTEPTPNTEVLSELQQSNP